MFCHVLVTLHDVISVFSLFDDRDATREDLERAWRFNFDAIMHSLDLSSKSSGEYICLLEV